MGKHWMRLMLGVFVVAAMLLQPSQAMANPRYASIVIDANTGEVLRERHADKVLHPASMTKMMTLYMVFDAMQKGKLNKNSRIRVSKHAASMVPSKLYLEAGSTIRLEDAIYALVTRSANDVAAAVGEAISGSEWQFGIDMTRKARELGMNSTTFKNASGLHHPQQVSTARDMARLSQALIHHFPNEYKYFNTNNFTYQGTSYRNHNGLKRTYTGMDGIKTGYINASGFNLAASAVQDNTRLIGIVFGGRTAASRNAHMAQIMDESFSRVRSRQTFAANARPTPKPQSLMYASLRSGQGNIQIAEATRERQGGNFSPIGLMIGEGDVDLSATEVVASLNSMAETNGGLRNVGTQHASLHSGRAIQIEDWSVQIGAFKDHRASSEALRAAAQKLPQDVLKTVKPQIITARTADGTVYRARFSGLPREAAVESCRILKDCIVMATAQ